MPTTLNKPISIPEVPRLTVDALVRSLGVNRGRPLCWLLGAGASISSGMPSAERCIWEWKRDIFVTNNPTLRESVGEISLPGTRQRIQRWLDSRGRYPPAGCASEYSFYAHECYPTGEDRRSFFQGHVSKAKPHTGYRLLPLLARTGIIRSVWTTNFDGLLGRACASSDVICIEVGIDTVHRATRQHSQGEVRLVSMHGDYRYDELKNTDDELRQQEAALRTELLSELGDYDLVVVGYSGRDDSLMNVLREAYSRSNPCRLFWCGFGETTPGLVNELISSAVSIGRTAFYIPTEGFDDLISRIALHQLEGDLLQSAKSLLADSPGHTRRRHPFTVSSLPPTSLVKSNAHPLSFPVHAFKLDLDIPQNVERRAWLDEHLKANDGVAVAMDNGALVLCDPLQAQKSFGKSLRSSPIAVAISETDIAKDGRIRSLLSRALVRSLSTHMKCETDGYRRIGESDAYEKRALDGTSYGIHRSLSLRLMPLEGKPHIVLMPEIVAKTPDGQVADHDASKILRNAIYGYQHNAVFDKDLKHWTEQITDVDIAAPSGGSFRISRVPIYAGLIQQGSPRLSERMQQHARQRGVVLPDSSLVFSSTNGRSEVRHPNPLTGLLQNRPWDLPVTLSGLSTAIDLAVICPSSHSGKLKSFLSRFQQKSQPASTERDYLQDFPGFAMAFGLPLSYPNPGDSSWIHLDDAVNGDALTAAKELAHRLCRALDAIRGVSLGSVVAVFVPMSWTPFKTVSTDSEEFNLHDYVKAYAARHGQSTQFIREETTISTQMCRVQWWLSLAIYAKALRTPWRIDCLDDETAFVGIGYSIESHAPPGGHILLGCSHLYSARGEGLQFRLGRIEHPVMRGRNPFMSEDDARRTGDTIRQLFFDAKLRLPRRVVVHKRTPFTDEEQRGFAQGLEGVENIELIEVNIEESLRYLASKQSNGKLEIDKFPIPRGALIVQNNNTALLWVHGSTPSTQNPKFRYYQGKRRIPAPLLIRRYAGESDVIQVATEILGLSKMNWNTFDYYSRLPATLDSASAIARVGTYLSGFGSAPYDYRLLI